MAIIYEKKKLICFYLSEIELDVIEFKNKLNYVMPEYMIPTIFFKIASIPLNENGKLDRKKLLKYLEESNQVNDKSLENLEKSEIDKRIVRLFEKHLKLYNIHQSTNFGTLGIDSLSNVMIVLELEKEFEMKLSGNTLYQFPTLKKLANYIELCQASGPLKMDGNSKEIVIQNKCYNELINKLKNTIDKDLDHRKVISFQVKEFYEPSIYQKVYQHIKFKSFIECELDINLDDFTDIAKIVHTINNVIASSDSFRTMLLFKDGKLISKVLNFAESFNYSILDYSTLDKKSQREIERNLINHTKEKIYSNLQENLLFHVLVFKCADNLAKVFFILHHCIADGATINILKKIFYKCHEESSSLKTSTFSDYIAEIRNASSAQSLLENDYTLKLSKIPILDKPIEILIGERIINPGALLNSNQQSLVIIDYITEEIIRSNNLTYLKFQALFDFRQVRDHDYSLLIGDCHSTLTYTRKASDQSLTFMNKLQYFIETFHFRDGIHVGEAIYSNFPDFSDEQNQLKQIYEVAPLNINYLGEKTQVEIDQLYNSLAETKKSLENLKNQIRFLCFSHNEEIHIIQLNGLNNV